MHPKSLTIAGALACAAALAVPAGASAGSFETGVQEVRQHTSRADAALDRARAHLTRERGREAALAFAQSRRQLAAASRDAARLRRLARNESQRGMAARAQALVAAQRDENVEQLVGMLDEAEGRIESQIAAAALADTRGRDKAVSVIAAIVQSGVSDEAAAGLARALAELSRERDGEIEAEAAALVGGDLSSRSQRIVVRTVGRNLAGQSRAAARLAELIASDEMPVESKQGLQRAYDRVIVEHERSADILARLPGHLPERIRAFVRQIVRQAREDAQGMRENRPAPPSGQPEGTPDGAPDGTPTGAPDGTPTGAPEGTPTGAPAGTPAGGAGA